MTFQVEENFDKWASNIVDFYEPGSRAELEFHFSRMLILASRRWTFYIDDVIRQRTGHTRAHWQTMFAIAFSKGPIATLHLSERLTVQWPTLIRTLKELEEKGFIRRWVNPEDRRSRLVELTDEGMAALREVKSILDPGRHDLFKVLSDKELGDALNVLSRVFMMIEERAE